MEERTKYKTIARVTSVVKRLELVPKAAGYVSAFFLVAAVVLVLAEIASRRFTGRSIDGVTEMSGWLMAGITWMALGYTAKENGHVQVRIIIDRLPMKVQRIIGVFLYAAACATILFLVVAMWGRVMYYVDRGQVGMENPIHIYWVYGVVFLGGCVLLLAFVLKFWLIIAALFGVGDETVTATPAKGTESTGMGEVPDEAELESEHDLRYPSRSGPSPVTPPGAEPPKREESGNGTASDDRRADGDVRGGADEDEHDREGR